MIEYFRKIIILMSLAAFILTCKKTSKIDTVNPKVIYEGKFDSVESKKKIKKALSFKKLFHKNDSSRLATRYIRWHKEFDSFELKRTKITWGFIGSHVNTNGITYLVKWVYDVKVSNGSLINFQESNYGELEEKPFWQKMLVVSNLGNLNNKTLLSNPESIETLINNLRIELNRTNSNAVWVDFEGIDKSQKENYNNFVAHLSQKLKEHSKGVLLFLTIPLIDFENYLDIEILVPVVDEFIFTPISKYKNNDSLYDVDSVFHLRRQYYLAKGIPDSKLNMLLPPPPQIVKDNF